VVPNGTSVPAQCISPSMEQSCNFGGPIQYFFNIGRINLDSNVSIGDFLSSLSWVASYSLQGNCPGVQGTSTGDFGTSARQG
jgi:hypothetical protein